MRRQEEESSAHNSKTPPPRHHTKSRSGSVVVSASAQAPFSHLVSSSSPRKSPSSSHSSSSVCSVGGKWSRSEVLAVVVTFTLASATMACVAYACYAQFDTFYSLKDTATSALLDHTQWSASLLRERAVVQFHAPVDALALSYEKSLLRVRVPPLFELESYQWLNESDWNGKKMLATAYDYGGTVAAFITPYPELVTEGVIETFLWRTGATDEFVATAIETWPQIHTLYVSLSNGLTRGYPYIDPLQAGFSPDLDLFSSPFYAPATPDNNPTKGRVWSDPYFDSIWREWMVSLLNPIFSLTDGSFLGVCGTDVLLAELVSFVAEATSNLPYHAYTMLVSKSGLILALPQEACTDWMSTEDTCDYSEIVRTTTYNASHWNIYERKDCEDLVYRISQEESGNYDSGNGIGLSTDNKMVFWSRLNETGWVVLTIVDSSAFLVSQVRANNITIAVVAVAGFVVVVAVLALAVFQSVRRQYGTLSNKIEALQIEVNKQSSKTALDEHLANCDVLKGGSEKLLSILRALITPPSNYRQGTPSDETGVVVNDQGHVFLTRETLEILQFQIIPSLARGDIYRAADLRANEFVTDEMYKVAVACQVVSSEQGSSAQIFPKEHRSQSTKTGAACEVDGKRPLTGPKKLFDSASIMALDQSMQLWEFSVFDELKKNEALFEMIFESTVVQAATDCAEELGSIDIPKLQKFGEFLHKGYNDCNPYHNSLHAMDVMQAVHWMMRLPCFIGTFTQTERLSIAIAAAAHDFHHPGVNTDFLRNTMHPIYVQYNGISPLESMHSAASLSAALGFGKAETSGDNESGELGFDWMRGIPLNLKQSIHKIVSQLVLATDMAKHVEIFGAFKDMLLAAGEKRNSFGVLDVFSKDTDRLLILKMILKLADLANTCRSWPVCFEWANKLIKEFSQQADAERSAGLTPFKLGDGSMTVDRLQLSFFPMFVFPVLSTICGTFPDLKKLEQFAHVNYDNWKKMADTE
ncbi:high affinity cAMP-specific 3',5'-cyclic phosphodiesterase 7A [Pelomyxa schiedti]|nr:high affinity cAMP-specific 3',5'-cyclic phosphodiesterase 7A [Pelomyxa schiedti]